MSEAPKQRDFVSAVGGGRIHTARWCRPLRSHDAVLATLAAHSASPASGGAVAASEASGSAAQGRGCFAQAPNSSFVDWETFADHLVRGPSAKENAAPHRGWRPALARLDEAALLGLVDGVYEASLDRGRWGPVLDRLSGLYDGKAILFQQDAERGGSDVVEFRGFDPGHVRSYVEHYAALNPCLSRRVRLPAGAVATDAMLVEREAAERSEFYNDWLRPQGLGAAVGAVLEKGENVSVHVAVLRAARRGPVTGEEFAFFERVAPHLRRALRLDRELAAARTGRDGAFDALEGLGTAALIADGGGRLLQANRRADALLSAATKAGGGLGTHRGRLCGPTPADTQALRAAIRACLLAGTGGVATPPAALSLARGRTAEPLSVLVCPLRGAGAAFALESPAALLLVHAPEDAPSFDPSRLARFYGLTPAEGRVLAGLLDGQSLGEHAAASGVSPNTAKTLLQRTFAKTGQARQSDLVRLVLSDPVSVAANSTRRRGVGRERAAAAA